MSYSKLHLKIALLEGAGFIVLALFIWADEILDLPHALFQGRATPINYVEGTLESIFAVGVGLMVCVITRDLVRRLQRANEEKDKLLALLSHDMKNSLTALLGSSSVLHKRTASLSRSDIAAMANGINHSAHTMYHLLENLLQWSSLQRGLIAANRTAFDLRDIVQRAIEPLKAQAAAKKIVWQNGLTAPLKVWADPTITTSVLYNLLSNAVKFTSSGGSVMVSVIDHGASVEVQVSDTGTGILPEEMPTLFDVHARQSKPGTQGEKGTGLGLAMCRDLCRVNGGVLTARSQPGQGSTFAFTLAKPAP